MTPRFQRILLKLSGEAFAGKHESGLDMETISRYAREIKRIHELGIQVAIVVGGGNIWRGRMAPKMERSTADYMGMLATVINALALQDALERENLEVRVQIAIAMQQIAEPFIKRRAVRHLEKGRVVVFAAGTGNPYFTTDTTAALRALEIGAQAILKATKVDGAYDRDPVQHPDAVMFKELKYLEVLEKGLKVMDSTAVSLCMDNKLPILVFNIAKDNNIVRICTGEEIGTLVKEER